MHIIFFIAIHYNTIKISNISCGFEILITMTIYCSVDATNAKYCILKRDMSQIKTQHAEN